jgi:hypothetical protein
MFPAIIQKYLIDWSASKHKGALNKLPWYLTAKDESFDETKPDYVIASGQDAVPACLYLTKSDQTRKCFSGKRIHFLFVCGILTFDISLCWLSKYTIY